MRLGLRLSLRSGGCKLLVRYWITFKSDQKYSSHHPGYGFGVGVTAYTLEDAMNLIEKEVFKEGLPKTEVVKADVKFDDLDDGHVKPNMGTISNRGIWYPLGFQKNIGK